VQLSSTQEKFLREQGVARLASMNPDGTIHLVPICFAFDGSTIFSTVIRGSKRLFNIARDPRVSIVVDDYEERDGQWVVLKGVLMYGTASLLTYGAQKERFMRGWRRLIEKYPQYGRWAGEDLRPTDEERRRIMSFRPRKVVSWGFD
jgi:PPOX class probable F420-dependent enzyme